MVSPPRQIRSSERISPARAPELNVRKYAPFGEKTRSSCDSELATTISPAGIRTMPVTPLNWVCVFDSLPISSVGRADSVQVGTLGCARSTDAAIRRRRTRIMSLT